MTKVIVADTETDGLAYDCTKIHVMAYTKNGTDVHHTNSYDEMKRVYESADLIVCHNED